MYIDYAKAMWPWLTEEEVIERLKNEIAVGRVVIATEEEIRIADAGEWRRVSTWAECPICGKPNTEHPYLDYDPFLHRLCDGVLGKT